MTNKDKKSVNQKGCSCKLKGDNKVCFSNDTTLGRGSRGPVGSKGTKGAPGERGLVGPRGHMGFKGKKGDRGPVGLRGPPGAGERGPRGPPGSMGFEGPTGPQGFQGPQGVQGVTGPDGTIIVCLCIDFKGLSGLFSELPINCDDGDFFFATDICQLFICDTNNWCIFNPSQDPFYFCDQEGNIWEVTSSDCSPIPGRPGDKVLDCCTGNLLEFGVTGYQDVGCNLMGATGATGATGPQGSLGPTGMTGVQGIPGSNTGCTGPRGERGATGVTGPQGDRGETGAMGENATIKCVTIPFRGRSGETDADKPLSGDFDGEFFLVRAIGGALCQWDEAGMQWIAVNMPDGFEYYFLDVETNEIWFDIINGGVPSITIEQQCGLVDGDVLIDSITGDLLILGPSGFASDCNLMGPTGSSGADGAIGPQGGLGPSGPTGEATLIKCGDLYRGKSAATSGILIGSVTGDFIGQLGFAQDCSELFEWDGTWNSAAVQPHPFYFLDIDSDQLWFATSLNTQAQLVNIDCVDDFLIDQLGCDIYKIDAASGLSLVCNIKGATGSSGADGAMGPQGAIGPQGPSGADGAMGSIGIRGITGATGPQGDLGPFGPTGEATLIKCGDLYQGKSAATSGILIGSVTGDFIGQLGFAQDCSELFEWDGTWDSVALQPHPFYFLDIDSDQLWFATAINTQAQLVNIDCADDFLIDRLGCNIYKIDGASGLSFVCNIKGDIGPTGAEGPQGVPGPLTPTGTFENLEVSGDALIEGKLTVNGLIDPSGLVLDEQSSNPFTTVSGKGTLWVQDDSPNILIFTDDTDTDHNLLETSAGPTGPPGAQGPAGMDGETGLPGLDGVTGATGPQGAAGSAGPPGPTGPQGAAAAPGPTGAYGEIYFRGNSDTTSLTTLNAFVKLVEFDANGVSSNVTADHTADSIIILEDGIYQVSAVASIFTTDIGEKYEMMVRVNSSDHDNLLNGVTLDTNGSRATLSVNGLLSLSAADVVELHFRCTSSASVSITVEHGNLNVKLIG